jgi:hypothetical protein
VSEPGKPLRRVREFNPHQLSWGVAGKTAGVHIWCSSDFHCGGFELHSAVQMYGLDEARKPDNETCWLIGRPCYHDGSSLWWKEKGRHLVADAVRDGDDTQIWEEAERIFWDRFQVQESNNPK